MVNDSGQLYTMEGVAAGLIMLVTAYIIISTTSVYTAGDTHIPDMQLEQLGSDVLAMMDTPDTAGGASYLKVFVGNNKTSEFEAMFLQNCSKRTEGSIDNLHMSSSISYRDGNTVKEHLFVAPDDSWTGRESAVRVTRWVQLDEELHPGTPFGSRARAVLVEVLLWRD
jgi:hypothetical protein